MSASIRQAVETDLPAVRRCAEAAYVMYVERIGKKPAPMVADFAAAIEAGNLHVAVESGKVVGFVVFYPRADHLHLENVAVDPHHQRGGIGKRLIEFVEAQAIGSGFDRVELYTNARMSENRAIYPRLGYVEFERRIEDGFDRIYYRKLLK